MALEPIDYSIQGVPSPFQSVAQGYQLGAGIRDDVQQQQALQTAQQQQVAQNQALIGLINNPNAGAKDYAAATLLMPKLKDQLNQAWTMKNTAQQESHLRDMGQAFSAVNAGRPDVATALLQRRADSMEAAGANPQEVQALRTQAQLIQLHPQYARTTMGVTLAALPGGDKMLTGISTAGTEQRAQDQAPGSLLKNNAEATIKAVEANAAPQKVAAELANVQSQINERAARLGLDQDKLTSETQLKVQEMRQKAGELPEPVMKNINEATGEAIASQQSAQKMSSLADQLAAQGNTGWGAATSAYEFIKKNLGMQNGLSQLRAEYNRIVTPAAMAAYKQVASGSTSDKDIETAMIGVPKDNASTDQMASFLRGTAKLQTYNAVLNNAKSEWFAANKHLGKTSQDTTIDGVQVPAGTTFKQFTDNYVAKKVGQVQGAQTVNSLAQKYGGGQ